MPVSTSWLLRLVLPIDVLPDFIPVLGQLDDLAFAYVALIEAEFRRL